jgi:hypothetical protein
MLQNSSHGLGSEAEKQQLIKNELVLSCHSKLLAELFPNISTATSKVPEFIHAEACMGDCGNGKLFHFTMISIWD